MSELQNITERPPEAQSTGEGNIYGMDVNYAAANSWYAFLPLENILGSKFKNLNLHLKQFQLPQLEIGSTTVSYKGYSKEIPTKVINGDSKQLTLEYIVDERWQNYRALYNWMCGIYGALEPTPTPDDTTESIQPSDYLPLRIYLLDNYKHKVIQFYFENCWIKSFNDVSLDVNNPAEVTHSFMFVYDQYYIEDID